MRDIELLKLQADLAFKEFTDAIEGVTEHQAWAKVECQPGEYMHSEGSILSIVAHVASCKQIYGSAGYRNLEVRFRDTVDHLNGYWPNWEATKQYLMDSQAYWLSTWAGETDLEREVMRFNGQMWPSWKIITTVTQHDCYHAGQIQVLRAILAPSETPPPNEAELWRKYCEPEPSW